MKKLKKVVGAAALGMMMLIPVTAQAWGNEGEYVHFFDSDIRLPLVSDTATFTQEKYDELIRQFNEKYQADTDALYADHEMKQTELDDLMTALDEQYSNEEITQEEYDAKYEQLQADREALDTKFAQDLETFETESDAALAKLEKQQENDIQLIETYELTTKEALSTVENLSTELLSLNPSISGLEYVPNLKNFTGEMGGEWTVSDTRSLLATPKLENLDIPISNQMNLNSMKNLASLKELNIYGGGYANRSEEEQIQEATGTDRYTETLLTDISALSNATNLKKMSISAEGALPVVTLKRGTTSYELVDPIILSSQLDGATISYESTLEDSDYQFRSNDLLKWEDLTGEEEVLLFRWDVKKDRFGFSGVGQIPIRWK